MVNRAHISICLVLLSGCLRKVPSGSASCSGRRKRIWMRIRLRIGKHSQSRADIRWEWFVGWW